MTLPSVERVTRCPCAGAALEPPAYAATIDGVRFGVRACPRCRRKVLDPRPREDALASWYDAGYFGAGEGKFVGPVEGIVGWYRDRRAREAAELFEWERTSKGGPPRVLDIGCGSGRFLAALCARGFECHGTELSTETSRRAAALPGLRLHVGPVRPDTYPEGSFELVSLWHVLEHLPDPDSMLRNCWRWLTEGGRLLFALPNIDSWQARLFRSRWFHLDPPRHLFHFGPGSLRGALAAAGFRIERLGHLSWEQSLYGVLQSSLNALGFPRDDLYEALKGGRRFGYAVRDYAEASLAAIGILPAAALTLTEAAFRCGGTLEGMAVKEVRPG